MNQMPFTPGLNRDYAAAQAKEVATAQSSTPPLRSLGEGFDSREEDSAVSPKRPFPATMYKGEALTRPLNLHTIASRMK